MLMIFDPTKAARELAEINGVPAKILRTDEQIAAIELKQEQDMQAAQLLEAAPVAANTAKTLLETQAMAAQGQPAIQ